VDDYSFRSTGDDIDVEDADNEPRHTAAKAAYQLHIAYLVGMGCDSSIETAIDRLLLSARLGFEDAQKAAFATMAALHYEISPHQRDEVIQWLTKATIHGDRACLQELRVLDQDAYQAAVTSKEHIKLMCERSGFMFDDDFIESNDVDDVPGLIAAILDSGEPIDSDIGGGLTWLHYAVFRCSMELAMTLVDNYHVSINAQNSRGQTPLWIACLSGNYEMSVFLLSRGADASVASTSGMNPLHNLPSFNGGNVEKIARMLLAQGADINERNMIGMTPLHFAVRGSGNLEEEPAVAVLLELGADPLIKDDEDETPFDATIYTLRPFYLERFLGSKVFTAMSRVELQRIQANALRVWVESLKHHRLRSGSLFYSERVTHLVRLLHTYEAYHLHIASHPSGFAPLHAACASSSDDLAAEIIKLPNAVLNQLDRGEYGYTPLMIAIRKSMRSTIEALVEAGADLVVKAGTGENILHHVVQYMPGLLPYICGQVEKQGIDMVSMCNEPTSWKGQTPLDYAISLGRSETVRFLLAKDANPNLRRESKENGSLMLNSLRFCLVPPSVRMLELLLPYMEPASFVCVSNGMNLLHLACIHVPDGTYS
jgi:ankyrin repeat protein